jgi:hypothetical protein
VSGPTQYGLVVDAEVEIVDTTIAPGDPQTCTSSTDPCVAVGVFLGNAGESACVVCPSPSARCVIDGFSTKTNDAAALLAAGMPLTPDVSCLLAQGAETALGAASPNDVNAKPRTPPFAMGAFELDRTCP